MSKTENILFEKAYVVTVDMGYGHQRAVYPLKDIAAEVAGISVAGDGIINANRYGGIPGYDKRRWEGGKSIYETISRMKFLPIIGEPIFRIMDYIQRIEPFYPARNLSRPSLQLKQIYGMIKSGWGKDLVNRLNIEPLPLISSFFTPAYFAEEHGYKEEIYMIVCDADISRAWAPLNPSKSRIKYLVPNKRTKERLKLYGVKEENIFITGFPLPKENIGGKSLKILKKALAQRIHNLDALDKYHSKYRHTLEEFLGKEYCSGKPNKAISITFAVGGAGAQRELGVMIMNSLRKNLENGEIILNLVAGIRNDVYTYYQKAMKEYKLDNLMGTNLNILYSETKMDYFEKFNQLLLTTDLLWTKPSELSFYAGLGLPIIMAPTVGSQENFNRDWLLAIGAGIDQQDPRYTNEWLFDWLKSGWLAEAAMKGFLDAPRMGAYHVEDIVLKGKVSEIEDIHLL